MDKHGSKLRLINSLIGIFICASAAALASYLFHGRGSTRTIVPIVFLAIITGVALRWGTVAGVVGSLVSAAIFAFFLFTPLGSLSVSGGRARSSLGWLLLGGLTLSVLFAPRDLGEGHKD